MLFLSFRDRTICRNVQREKTFSVHQTEIPLRLLRTRIEQTHTHTNFSFPPLMLFLILFIYLLLLLFWSLFLFCFVWHVDAFVIFALIQI